MLAVAPRPVGDTPDGSPLGDKLLHFELPTDMPGVDVHRRVPVERCNPCTNPHDRGDMPKYLGDDLSQYVLNNFTTPPPKYHVTQDDASPPCQRLEIERITGHQSVRARGRVIAVMYETHWTRLSRPSL